MKYEEWEDIEMDDSREFDEFEGILFHMSNLSLITEEQFLKGLIKLLFTETCVD